MLVGITERYSETKIPLLLPTEAESLNGHVEISKKEDYFASLNDPSPMFVYCIITMKVVVKIEPEVEN